MAFGGAQNSSAIATPTTTATAAQSTGGFLDGLFGGSNTVANSTGSSDGSLSDLFDEWFGPSNYTKTAGAPSSSTGSILDGLFDDLFGDSGSNSVSTNTGSTSSSGSWIDDLLNEFWLLRTVLILLLHHFDGGDLLNDILGIGENLAEDLFSNIDGKSILTGVLGFAGEIFDDLFSSFGSSSGGF